MATPKEPESEAESQGKIPQDIHNRIVDQYYKVYEYCTKNFDNQSFLISGGALGISLSFIKDIVPLQQAILIYVFYLAMALFIACLTLGFISHHRSMKFSLCELKKAHALKYKEFQTDDKTDKINNWTFWLLIVGLIALVGFCVINIEYFRRHREQVQPGTTQQIKINKRTDDGSSITVEGEMKNFQLMDTANMKTQIEIK